MKKSGLGFLLMLLMVLSTFGYVVLQGSYYKTREQEIELPKERIIDYRLTDEQERSLIINGYTIVVFEYSLTCDNCLDVKTTLEQLAATDPNGQLIVEELNSGSDVSRITVVSIYGKKELENATSDEVFDVLCELLVYPPTSCALREV